MKSFRSYFTEEVDKKDTITFDIPLLIRVLELTREDIKSDMDLHRVVERLIDIRNKGTLTMDDYNFVAKLKEEYVSEMDKSQEAPGRDDPYDYNKGKWQEAKPVVKNKASKIASDILSKSFNQTNKKTIKEDGAVSAGPTCVVGGGAIAGTGSGPDKKSAEPSGPYMGFFRRKKKILGGK